MSTVETITEGKFAPQVKDLMTKDVFTLFEDDNIKFLKDLMKWQRIRHVPVVNQDNVLVGLVTHRDFLKAAISRLAQVEESDESSLYREIPVSEVMRKNVTTVHADTPLAKAAELMFTQKYGCLPVVESGRLVGIITEADFVRSFYEWNVNFTES
ncbi:MAG: CBS domain-containing protein [Bdellovibrionaceae bacterium]|nr:CBS domain-containing protein [Bdellovibrionales bacterium]MCB9082747.1 CBS domain-containing protein [Pseudobdellovibrionaceae bacterium]